jgi:hypothetical protein
VVYIVLNDVGSSAMSCCAEPVATPNFDTIGGEGLAMGRDVGDPVTEAYPGERPHRFTGGTIKRVAIDVSGEPFMDLDRDVQTMLIRE